MKEAPSREKAWVEAELSVVGRLCRHSAHLGHHLLGWNRQRDAILINMGNKSVVTVTILRADSDILVHTAPAELVKIMWTHW